MGKQYKPKPTTGSEYVEAAKKLHQYTMHIISRMPTEMKSYALDPLFHSSQTILRNVIMANAVYINNKDAGQMIQALEDRDAYLVKALRTFDVFHANLDNLMGHVNLLKAERLRLKNILEEIILENGYQPDGWQETPNDIITIQVKGRLTEIEYEAMNGNVKVLRLGLTSRNADHWLLLCTQARELISKRIAADKAAISKMNTTVVPAK